MRNLDWKSFKISGETCEFMPSRHNKPHTWITFHQRRVLATYSALLLGDVAIMISRHFIFPSNLFSLLYLHVSAVLGGFITRRCRGLRHIPAAQHLQDANRSIL